MEILKLPRASLWNLAEMDRDYAQAKLPESAEVVLDIGSHAGIFALWALGTWQGCKVVCFEPHPEMVKICRDNLTGLSAEVHELAVIGSEDVASCVGDDNLAALYEGKRTLLGSSLHHLGWQKDEIVARVRWFPAADLPPCNVLKVDIEGSDLRVLKDYRHGAGLSALLCEVHRREEWPQLMELAWSWGLEMTRCNAGRNGCVTSAWRKG